MVVLYFSIFIIACLILTKAGTYIAKALINISGFLNLKKFTVASLIMTVVSSLPEIFIGVSAAFHNKQQLSLGNVMGSNIIVLTLVIGIGGLIAKGLSFKTKTIRRASYYSAIISPLPLILMLDGKIDRIDGIILFTALFFYFHQLILQEKRFTKTISAIINGKKRNNNYFYKNIGLLLLSVLFLLGSAEMIVWSASRIANELNLSLSIIGLLLVAIGTSTPELSFGIRSITMGHEEMLLGDAIGSVVINSALVIGTMAIIRPFSIPDLSPYFVSMLFTIVIASVFAGFARSDHEISETESIFLIFIYVLFLMSEVIIAY
jgi:cation:H+ antiporter